MTTSVDVFSGSSANASEGVDARARRAVKAFRALQPTLTSYARIMTGRKDVQVVASVRNNGATDGTRIYYRPPIGLADRTPHEKRQCNKRHPETKEMLCPACRIREFILVTIYHEIAHIVWNSFAQTSDEEKGELLARGIAVSGSRYAAAIARRIETAPEYKKNSYIGMASLISEYLPMIVNALEDARVNNEIFKARKGTKTMFDARATAIFRDGVESRTPSGELVVTKWSECPANQQVIVGTLIIASGYTFDGWFAPEVEAALRDPELVATVNKVQNIKSASGVYSLSFEVLDQLRKLGFCKMPDDPDEPEPETGDTEQSDDSDGSSDGDDRESGEEGDPQDTADSDADDADSGASAAADEGSSGSDDDERPESSDDSASTDDSGSGEAADDGESDTATDSDGSGDVGTDQGDDEQVEGEGSDDGEGAGSGEDNPEESGNDSPGGRSDADDRTEGDGSSQETGSSSGPSGDASDSAVDDDSRPDETGASDDSDLSGDDPLTGQGNISADSEPGEAEQSSSEDGADGSGKAAGSEPSDEPVEGEGEPGRSPGQAMPDESGEADHGDPGSEPRPEGVDGQDPSDHSDTGDASGHGDDQPDAGADENLSGADGDIPEQEPIDTGADEGLGGLTVIEGPEEEPLPEGTPEDARIGLVTFGDHDREDPLMEGTSEERDAIEVAIIQGEYFETPSRNITGVREHRFGKVVGLPHEIDPWDTRTWEEAGIPLSVVGVEGDFMPPESILGPALLRMRVAFSENDRAGNLRNLKSGKVDSRVLGKRVFLDEPRLMKKKVLPKKRRYLVIIGIDISGSTIGVNLMLAKRAAMAQAELCHRVGVQFAIFAHSGDFTHPELERAGGISLDIFHIKDGNEPWSPEVRSRLEKLGSSSSNLDGHSLEFYRKLADRSDATDVVILYYSDGKMPAENYNEELVILQREIRICRQKRYTLLGVGIRTDSPARHGLDTVQVDDDADIVRVVRHLERRLVAV